MHCWTDNGTIHLSSKTATHLIYIFERWGKEFFILTPLFPMDRIMLESSMHLRHHLSCSRHLLFFWWLSLVEDDLPPMVNIAMGGQCNSCLLTVWITVVLFFFIEAIIFLWKVCRQSPHTLYLWSTLHVYVWTGPFVPLQNWQAGGLL